MNAKMIGENPIKTNKAKAEDQIIIYYAIQSTVVKSNLWRGQLKFATWNFFQFVFIFCNDRFGEIMAKMDGCYPKDSG